MSPLHHRLLALSLSLLSVFVLQPAQAMDDDKASAGLPPFNPLPDAELKAAFQQEETAKTAENIPLNALLLYERTTGDKIKEKHSLSYNQASQEHKALYDNWAAARNAVEDAATTVNTVIRKQLTEDPRRKGFFPRTRTREFCWFT